MGYCCVFEFEGGVHERDVAREVRRHLLLGYLHVPEDLADSLGRVNFECAQAGIAEGLLIAFQDAIPLGLLCHEVGDAGDAIQVMRELIPSADLLILFAFELLQQLYQGEDASYAPV